MEAPTNPAYMMDPTFFQRSNDQEQYAATSYPIHTPPLSIFIQALRPEIIRSTGFLPRHIPRTDLGVVYFSEANLQWLQQEIVKATSDRLGISTLKMALPDATNLQLIMQATWDKFYQEGRFSGRRSVQMNLGALDASVTEQCVVNITQGISAQVDYMDKVTKGPNYADPFLQTVSAGDTKLSTSGGTLNTSAVVFGTNKQVASAVPTPSSSTRSNTNTTDWTAVAAEDAAFQSQGGYRNTLTSLP